MLPSQELCLHILRTKGFIYALDLSNLFSYPDMDSPALNTLQQLHHDLHEAQTHINPTQFATLPANDREHVKLIKCSVSLVTVLVTKLSHLERFHTSGLPFKRISILNSLMYNVCLGMQMLLVTSCQTFNRLPRCWPIQDHDQNAPIRCAMHSLLSFMQQVHHGMHLVWQAVADNSEPTMRQCRISWDIAMVPIAYLTGIGLWVSQHIIAEVSALPADFFSLLICITVEIPIDLRADASPGVCKVVCGVPRLFDIAGIRDLTVLYLGEACNKLVIILLKANQTFCMERFNTPEMMQLQKHTIAILSQGKHYDMGGADYFSSAMFVLTLLLSACTDYKLIDLCTPLILDVPALMARVSSNYASCLIRPVFLVSDTQLLKTLFKAIMRGPSAFTMRNQLAAAIMRAWRDTTHPCLAVKDQIRWCQVLAHHCTLKGLAWMQQQQQHVSQSLVYGSDTSNLLLSSEAQGEEMGQLLAISSFNTAFIAYLCGLDMTSEMSGPELRLRLRSASDCLPLSLCEFKLSGNVALLEMSLRGELASEATQQVLDAMQTGSSALLLPHQYDQQGATLPYVSLAATRLKRLNTVLWKTARDSDATQQQRNKQLWHQLPQQQTMGDTEMRQTLLVLLSSHHETIKTLEGVLISSGFPLYVGGVSRELDPKQSHAVHQLQTILLVSWVQLCRFLLSSDQVSGVSRHLPFPGWVGKAVRALGTLGKGLPEVVASLLPASWSPSSLSNSKGDLIWERYALVHFHGRLTPGCCYMGCSNLSGVSEAALKTQLCSGCRRARYCSVECQKAAWADGGHSTVCKEKEML